MPASPISRRVPELDGIRGLAILLVILWHYFACQINASPGYHLGAVARVLGLCWSGVDLFFVLSGYLICGILLDHRNSPHYFRTFYLRRACRILPLYFLVVLAYGLIRQTPFAANPSFAWLLQSDLPFWGYFTFTQNIHMSTHENFGPHWLAATWSLAVEEQFYLLFPLVVRWLAPRAFLVLLGTGTVIALGLRLAYPGFSAFFLLPFRMDALFMGCLAAMLMRSPRAIDWIRNNPGFLKLPLVALSAVLVYLTWKGTWPGRWNLTALSLFYTGMLLLILLNREGTLAGLARNRLLRFLGTISFGLYLIHQPVSGLLHGMVDGTEPRLASWTDFAVTAVALCLSVTLAWLSERFLERRITSLGHKAGYGPNSSIFTPTTAT